MGTYTIQPTVALWLAYVALGQFLKKGYPDPKIDNCPRSIWWMSLVTQLIAFPATFALFGPDAFRSVLCAYMLRDIFSPNKTIVAHHLLSLFGATLIPTSGLVHFCYATCALEFGSAFYCMVRMNIVKPTLYRITMLASHVVASCLFCDWVGREGILPRTWLPIAAIMAVLVIGREREAHRIAPI